MVRAVAGLASAPLAAGGASNEIFLLRCSERLGELGMHVALLWWGTFTALEDELRT
jgi:hypothetical protein